MTRKGGFVYVDDLGRIRHRCSVEGCENSSTFGVGVRLLEYLRSRDKDPALLGVWYCRQHLPPDYFANRDKAHQQSAPAVSDGKNRTGGANGRGPVKPTKSRRQFINGQGALL